MSVVGFDDIPEAAFFQPALTTVRLDFDSIGRRGVSLLLEMIRGTGADTPAGVLTPPELIVRGSAASPPD